MPPMNDQGLSRFETQLERLIEGAFAKLLSKTISAHDIALHVVRAMEDDLWQATDGDPRPFAPDQYAIRMNPNVHYHLLTRQPSLGTLLAQHIIELAAQSGYRLNNTPIIQIIADPDYAANELKVQTQHVDKRQDSTAVMERIDTPRDEPVPHNPQLIINGQKTVKLRDAIINLGRGRDNHIVLDDPYCSRHHAQLRLRFGRYTLFDTNSASGLSVNEVAVREHRLQPGDVIRLGKTQLVYWEDTVPGDTGINEPQ